MKIAILAIALSVSTFSMASSPSNDTSSNDNAYVSQEDSAKHENSEQNSKAQEFAKNWLGDGWCYSSVWGWMERECYVD
jgi:hypothetical protein